MTKHNHLRIGWQAWRNTSDKITASPQYGSIPLLLNLARFARREMAHFNTAYHAGQSCKLP